MTHLRTPYMPSLYCIWKDSKLSAVTSLPHRPPLSHLFVLCKIKKNRMLIILRDITYIYIQLQQILSLDGDLVERYANTIYVSTFGLQICNKQIWILTRVNYLLIISFNQVLKTNLLWPLTISITPNIRHSIRCRRHAVAYHTGRN